jgi:t-SNARE complex subunit (syntaxin)
LQYDFLFIILGKHTRDHVKPNNLIAMGKNKKAVHARKEEIQAKRVFQIVVIVLIILCLVLLLSSSFFA